MSQSLTQCLTCDLWEVWCRNNKTIHSSAKPALPLQTLWAPPRGSLAARGRVHRREGARCHALVLRPLPLSLLQGPGSRRSQVQNKALHLLSPFMCACELCELINPLSVFQGAFSETAGAGPDQGPDFQTGRQRPVPKERRHRLHRYTHPELHTSVIDVTGEGCSAR